MHNSRFHAAHYNISDAKNDMFTWPLEAVKRRLASRWHRAQRFYYERKNTEALKRGWLQRGFACGKRIVFWKLVKLLDPACPPACLPACLSACLPRSLPASLPPTPSPHHTKTTPTNLTTPHATPNQLTAPLHA